MSRLSILRLSLASTLGLLTGFYIWWPSVQEWRRQNEATQSAKQIMASKENSTTTTTLTTNANNNNNNNKNGVVIDLYPSLSKWFNSKIDFSNNNITNNNEKK